MLQNHGIHLGYCTNIHRGEAWQETWRGLQEYTVRVKERVSGDKPYGIGLRLSEQAARELSQPASLVEFQRWLEANNCYVFTINGFPYGAFHGTRVKERSSMATMRGPRAGKKTPRTTPRIPRECSP